MSTSQLPKQPRDLFTWLYWGIFLIFVPLTMFWMSRKNNGQVDIPVFRNETPAFHIITAQDVTMFRISADSIMTDTIRDGNKLVLHYTRDVVRANEPIRDNQISNIKDVRLISDTLAVAIPADSVTILGGILRPGDIVRLSTIPISDTTSTPTTLLDAVLILDIKSIETNREIDRTVILAIPNILWHEYLVRIRNAKLVLSRRVE